MLSESWLRPLQRNVRVRHLTLMLRAAYQRQLRPMLCSETRSPLLLPLRFRRQYQPYATAALHSTACDDHGVATSRTKERNKVTFEHVLLQCEHRLREDPSPHFHSLTISELWNAYLNLKRKPTLEEYNGLIAVLHSRARETRQSVNWTRIITAYQDAVVREALIPTSSMVRTAMEAYGRVSKFAEAKAVFDTLPAPDKDDYLSLLKAATMSGKAEDAFSIVQASLEHDTATVSLLEQFVSGHLKRGSMRKAMDAVRLMGQTYWSDTTAQQLYTGYVDIMTNHQLVSQPALQSLHWHDPAWLEAFAVAFARMVSSNVAGLSPITVPDEKKALFTVQQLDTLFSVWLHSHPSLAPTTTTCNVMLDLHVSRNDFVRVKQVLSLMQSRSVQPSAPTVDILVRAFGDVLPIREQQALYDTLRSTKDFGPASYNAFLCAFAKGKYPNRARRVARDMMQQGLSVDTKSHCTLVQSYVACGRLNDAAKWLSRHCQPTWKGDALDPYAILMEGWLHQGAWKQCVHQMRVLVTGPCGRAARTHPRIVQATVMALCANQQWRRCEQLLASCKVDFSPATVGYMMVTLLNLKRGPEYLVSFGIVRKALETMERTRDVGMSPGGVSQVIEALGERGQVEDAYHFYKWTRGEEGSVQEREVRKQAWLQMKRERSLICRTMMEAAISNNDIGKAEKVWYDLKRVGYAKQTPSLSAYNALLNSYASRMPQPKINGIRKTFQRILDQQLTPDLVTYNTLIKAFIHADNHQAANEVFQSLLGAGITPDNWTVNTMLQSWISRRDWRGVEQWIKTLRQQYPTLPLDTTTLNLLIRGFLHLDHPTLRHIELLKTQHKYALAKRVEQEYWRIDPYPVTSNVIWTIFETVTGCRRAQVEAAIRRKGQPVSITQYITKDNIYHGACHGIVQAIQEHPAQARPDGTGTAHATFVSIFLPPNGVKPDATTYQLFMKAFSEAGDKKSADTIRRYRNLV